MAINKNHQAHLDMMGAFESAEKNTPSATQMGTSYPTSPVTGMPRTTAQMASVKKAAQKSALARGERAATTTKALGRTPTPTVQKPPGVATGSVGSGSAFGVKPKKGLLSL
jgi:hypothetical protein